MTRAKARQIEVKKMAFRRMGQRKALRIIDHSISRPVAHPDPFHVVLGSAAAQIRVLRAWAGWRYPESDSTVQAAHCAGDSNRLESLQVR
jgi:hypothetical protein